MIVKVRLSNGKGWSYTDNVHYVNCEPAKVANLSMTESKAQTTIVTIFRKDGSKEVLGIETEAYLLNDEGKTLEKLHK